MSQVGILFKNMYKCKVSLKRCPVFTNSKIACKLKGDVIMKKAMTSWLPPVYTHDKAMQLAGNSLSLEGN